MIKVAACVGVLSVKKTKGPQYTDGGDFPILFLRLTQK